MNRGQSARVARCCADEARGRRTHETAETLERPGDANMRVDLNENALCGVDVDLQESRLVERRVEQREQALGTQALASASAPLL